MRRRSPLLSSGYDPIGPFHPYVIWAAVLLLDLAGAAAILLGLAWAVDKAEDWLAPGGEEWIAL